MKYNKKHSTEYVSQVEKFSVSAEEAMRVFAPIIEGMIE